MNVVILAAGKGKRMYSASPKVLQLLAGKPLLKWVLDTVEKLDQKDRVVVVVGHQAEAVMRAFPDAEATFVIQSEQKGTAHAVAQSLSRIDAGKPVLVLYGDVPLVSVETLEALVDTAGDGVGLLTQELENPAGYGRIVRENGRVVGIVEEKDASGEQRKIKEINTGIMVLPGDKIEGWLSRVKCDNSQHEYYLTDLIAMAVEEDVPVRSLVASDRWEVEGVNDRVQLQAMERALQRKLANGLLRKGVRLADAERIDVRGELVCGKDVFIDVGCVFEGRVVLGDNVQIGPYCVVKNSEIGDNTKVDAFTHIDQSRVACGAIIGPYARLRPGAVLANEVHVGNFVEIKKSVIGEGSKVNHLSYIGDCTMGSGVNIGAGTITCNYDGANKFRTVIEDDCFIGSDTQLVAPVTVEKGATVAAGTTVTKDVPAQSLAIRRPKKQDAIPGWIRPKKR